MLKVAGIFVTELNKMGELPQLPPELVTRILAMALETEPVCAFDLFVPDWNLCSGKHAELEEVLRSTRFDTYTAGEGGQGYVSTTFGHCGIDCIHLPLMEHRGLLPIEPNLDREMVKEWSSRSVMIFQQKYQKLGPLADPDLADKVGGCFLLRNPDAVKLYPYVDLPGAALLTVPAVPGTAPGEGRTIFLYERMRHVMFNADSKLFPLGASDFGIMPDHPMDVAQDTIDKVRLRLEVEQFSHLLVNWSLMPRLETLFLDLRKFSWDVLDDMAVVEDAARRLAGKGLELLVVAGLRSYALYPGPAEMVWENCRGPTDRSDFYPGGVDWIRMFKLAVRPGGRLILIDKQLDAIRTLPFRPQDQFFPART